MLENCAKDVHLLTKFVVVAVSKLLDILDHPCQVTLSNKYSNELHLRTMVPLRCFVLIEYNHYNLQGTAGQGYRAMTLQVKALYRSIC